MIKNILILITMLCCTSLSHAIELVNEEKSKMQDKGITDLIITDNKVGDGREAEKGLTVTVHYTGWLYENGEKTTKFDSSVDRREPFSFVLGVGQVIKGMGQRGKRDAGWWKSYHYNPIKYGLWFKRGGRCYPTKLRSYI
jgi:hypothetical protein